METGDRIAPSINSLPDEILLKIIQMATRKFALYVGEKTLVDHFYLINVISQVSTRFKKIVSDKAFWEKEVYIALKKSPKMKHVIDCLGTNIRKIQFYDPEKFIDTYGARYTTSTEISVSCEDILSLQKKATDLRSLELCGLDILSWPTHQSAWSLEELILRDINMPWYTFQNVAIHRYLPNLRAFKMIRCTDESGASIMLPDLSQCQRLEEVRIAGNNVGYNAYCFPTDLGEQIPFPRGLKSLEVPNVVFDGISSDEFDEKVKDLIEMFADDCEVIDW